MTGEDAYVATPPRGQDQGCNSEDHYTTATEKGTSDDIDKVTGDNWQVGFTHIDESMIVKNVKDIASRVCYICGPYEMMIMIAYILQKLGVEAAHISSELW